MNRTETFIVFYPPEHGVWLAVKHMHLWGRDILRGTPKAHMYSRRGCLAVAYRPHRRELNEYERAKRALILGEVRDLAPLDRCTA